jgi:hypothetical protein
VKYPQRRRTREEVEGALVAAGWNVQRAAGDLGVSRARMYQLIDQLGLHDENAAQHPPAPKFRACVLCGEPACATRDSRTCCRPGCRAIGKFGSRAKVFRLLSAVAACPARPRDLVALLGRYSQDLYTVRRRCASRKWVSTYRASYHVAMLRITSAGLAVLERARTWIEEGGHARGSAARG